MDQEKWLAASDPMTMLNGLRISRVRVSGRKHRLFAVACARRVSHLIPDPESRAAVDVAEAVADGTLPWTALEPAAADAAVSRGRDTDGPDDVATWESQTAAEQTCAPDAKLAARTTAALVARVVNTPPGEAIPRFVPGHPDEQRHQAHLLQDIIGNPFRPVTLNPAWLTPTVTGLAAAIYDERAFDRMPVLADALEEAGCDHPDVLAHCRGEDIHERGCWVLDLVIGKA